MLPQQKQQLLSVARQAIAAEVSGRKAAKSASDDPELNEPCGAFVTMHNHGQLRGCIGTFTADGPLIETIHEMVVGSTRDSRRRAAGGRCDRGRSARRSRSRCRACA